jgi:hypothetical protein
MKKPLLKQNNIRHDYLIIGLLTVERILINDKKRPELLMAYALNTIRAKVPNTIYVNRK